MVSIADTLLAYFAGIVDGEGCIRAMRSFYTRRKTGERVLAYSASVVVVNTNRPLLKLFKANFGGSIHPRKLVRNRKPCFSWHIGNRAAAVFLERLLPYLREKKRQAVVAIHCQKLNGGKRTLLVTKQQRHLFQRLKEMKRA